MMPAHATPSAAPWWRRMLTVPNVVSVLLGVTVWLLLVRSWDSHLGALVAAAAGALVTGGSWWAWWHLKRPPTVASVLSSPLIGTIPEFSGGPAPTITAPDSPADLAFQDALEALESETSGQVLLVMSPSPGQGASSAALNLAIAASRAGRRVVLVDGDVATGGLSRFGRTGAIPGLAELARGEVDLATASRIWNVDSRTRLPFIPAGAAREDAASDLSGIALADAIDRLTEKADLVIVDAAPIMWNEATKPLAAHADGTLLVVSPAADTDNLARTFQALGEAGAPVVGYLMNRTRSRAAVVRRPAVRMLKRSLATFFIVGLTYLSWNAAQIYGSFAGVERDELDVAIADRLLPLPEPGDVAGGEIVTRDQSSAITALPQDEGRFLSFLIVGTDSRENLTPEELELFGDYEGARADVIILALLPNGPGDPALVSIPRDLYVLNRCTQSYTRINAALEGCGDDVNGPTLLALTVEDFTGIEVDHFALFDFEGFERIIDEMGGVEICLDYPVRDSKALLDLPAGCNLADGAQALAWVRSRRTQELVDGTWRIMPGVNDLARNQRQQDLILDLFEKIRSFDSPADLAGKVRSLTSAFTLDDKFGIGDAIALAWDLRSLDLDRIHRISIPVVDAVAPNGAAVLTATVPFDELLAEVYPPDIVDQAHAGQ